MKKKTKLLGIAAGALVLLLGAGYTVFVAPRLKQEKWIYIESEVSRGALKVGVTESGTLDYGITSVLYDLDLRVADSEDEEVDEDATEEETIAKYLKIEEIPVAIGQRVKSGDILVQFTAESVEGLRKTLESALVDAKADYGDAESEYDLAVLEAKTNYEITKVSEKYASAIYQNEKSFVEGEYTSLEAQLQLCKNKVTALEERVTEAEEAYAEARENYLEAQKSMDNTGMDNPVNFVTVQELFLSAQTRYENAETTLTQAKENLESNAAQMATLQSQLAGAAARKGIEKLEAENSYQESVIEGENAQVTYDAKLESLREDLQEEEEELRKMQEQLEAFEAFVGEDGCLYAEDEGIVTEVAYEAGDKLTTAGTVVAYATMGDMTITVDVTQEDVVSLAVGNSVEVVFAAYPDETYQGTITSINTTATSRDSATISYQVVVKVEGDTRKLYGGMTADITFVTEEKEDVSYVSRKAIVEQGGKTYVYVAGALGSRELREVETGIRNSSSVEIVSGLEEDDTIYIASRVSDEEALEASDEEEDIGENAEKSLGDGEMPFEMNGEMPAGDFPRMNGSMPGGGEMPGGGNRSERGAGR